MRLRWAAAALSGVLLAAAFPEPGAEWLLTFCFVPLLVALDGSTSTSSRSAFFLGWVAGLAFYAWAFSWVGPATGQFHRGSPSTVVPVFGLFIAYHAIPFGVFAVARIGLGRFGLASPGAIAALWVVVDASFPKVFPWSVGTALSEQLWAIGIVAVAGNAGLDFLVVVANAVVADVVRSAVRRDGRSLRNVDGGSATPRPVRRVAILVAALVCVWGFGQTRTPDRDGDAATTSSLRIGVVQAGGSVGRFDPVDEDRRLDSYMQRSRSLGAVDLIVWPETAVRVNLDRHAAFRNRIQSLVDNLQTPLLLGAPTVERHGTLPFNAAYLFSPESPPEVVYRKQFLVSFAESFPILESWGRYTGGDQSAVIEVAGVQLALSICYEAFLPGFFNPLIRDERADVLINLTDDTWFSRTTLLGNEPAQHLQGAIFRAVETRRWLIRASSSGISAAVAPSGDVVQKISFGERSTFAVDVPRARGQTLYSRFGDWFAFACGAYLVVGIASRHRR